MAVFPSVTIAGGVIVILTANYGILANVAVLPGHTGMGMGRVLIDQAETICRSHARSELRLTTHGGPGRKPVTLCTPGLAQDWFGRQQGVDVESAEII